MEGTKFAWPSTDAGSGGINLKKYFTGIGSRSTPSAVEPLIKLSCHKLVNLGYTLRSGGASGADQMFEKYYDLYGGEKEIYLPWPNYNDNKSPLYGFSNTALKLAEKYHPKWDRLTESGKKLMARNSHIILGPKCIVVPEFVICWTPGGKEKGGTGQGIRMAKDFRIPIFNLALVDDISKLESVIDNQDIF